MTLVWLHILLFTSCVIGSWTCCFPFVKKTLVSLAALTDYLCANLLLSTLYWLLITAAADVTRCMILLFGTRQSTGCPFGIAYFSFGTGDLVLLFSPWQPPVWLRVVHFSSFAETWLTQFSSLPWRGVRKTAYSWTMAISNKVRASRLAQT